MFGLAAMVLRTQCVDEMATCAFCDNSVPLEDFFCSGCNSVVCEDCDLNDNLPFGSHSPEDHLECIMEYRQW